ncbi:MAG TPA: ATP-binding protein [Mycobacteriales bacterium]|nr:ATP-binding protein [Mycobacteriales bacterium]
MAHVRAPALGPQFALPPDRVVSVAHVELPVSRASPGIARRAVSDVLGAWSATAVDTALLLVSELVTNAVQHGGSDVTLDVQPMAPDRVRIGVSDGLPGAVPVVRWQDDNAEGGRGMLVVACLADAWGIDVSADRKSVWFEICA